MHFLPLLIRWNNKWTMAPEHHRSTGNNPGIPRLHQHIPWNVVDLTLHLGNELVFGEGVGLWKSSGFQQNPIEHQRRSTIHTPLVVPFPYLVNPHP